MLPFAGCLLLVAALLVSAGPAGAQAGEQIRDYQVSLRVNSAGSLLVSEDITYDFGAEERHGIFREIPVRFHYDDRYDRIYDVEDVSVRSSPGTPVQVERETSGGTLSLRIGDPDRTIRGVHRYLISYRVDGALNGFEDHDELFWNAIGADWESPSSGRRSSSMHPATSPPSPATPARPARA